MQRAVLSIALIGPWSACQPSDPSEREEPPETDAAAAWVDGMQAARRERAELTEVMEALFQVSLETHNGAAVELTLANLSDRDVAEYGGLLHLRDAAGERGCTLWLSEQKGVSAGETQRWSYNAEGAFATDSTPVSELQGVWGPYRIVFTDGEVLAKPWPTQSWWPWCQSQLSRSAE
jgi:hypothetical protein